MKASIFDWPARLVPFRYTEILIWHLPFRAPLSIHGHQITPSAHRGPAVGARGNSPSTTPQKLSPTMALRMVYDKAMGFAAKQYRGVLGNQLAQYGEFVLAALYVGMAEKRRGAERR